MSELQYIGARYVPLFSDPIEWQNNIAYEPLTIVTRFGNSYTSKKAVPAGFAPENSAEYWVITGNYNAQIEEYKNDVVGVKEAQRAADAAIATHTGEIDALQDEVAKIENDGILMIGDSYGEQNDGSVTKFYWEQIRDNLGLVEGDTFLHAFESGAGFINTRFNALLNGVVNSTTAETRAKIKKIVVCGGWNDSPYNYQTGDFTSAILIFKNSARVHFPNAEVYIAHISWGLRNNPRSSDLGQLLRSINWYSTVGRYGFRYISNSEYILHDYRGIWQAEDGVHPNQAGQDRLATYLTSAIVTGCADVVEQGGSGGYTPDGIGVSVSAQPSFNSTICNGTNTINGNGLDVTVQNGSYTMDGSTRLVLGSVRFDFWQGFVTTQKFAANCYFVLNDNTLETHPCTLVFENDQISFIAQIEEGAAWKTYTNIKRIGFLSFCFTSNSLFT